jgi:hypothetical protein
MNRDQFIQHLENGLPATKAVRAITGHTPAIVTIAEGDDGRYYRRYGIMMAGPVMAALVVLEINVLLVPPVSVDRIRAGEPCGLVLKGMIRNGYVQSYGITIRSGARLSWNDEIVGSADEIFTESLFS